MASLNPFSTLLGVTRPKFLILAPICVGLALAASWYSNNEIDWITTALILVGATLGHVAVNVLNEVADFHSGLDFMTQRTPFSGGSGTLINHPALAPRARQLAIIAVGLVMVCGAALLQRVGLGLLWFGVPGLFLILLYGGPISTNRWAVLIAPGLGFGPMMVGGAYYSLSGGIDNVAVICSAVVFALVNNLLLLNQFPDRQADVQVGRDNWAIASTAIAAKLYTVFAIGVYATIAIGWLTDMLPSTALLGLLTIPISLKVCHQTLTHSGKLPLSALSGNVLVTLLTPVLLALGLTLARLF